MGMSAIRSTRSMEPFLDVDDQRFGVCSDRQRRFFMKIRTGLLLAFFVLMCFAVNAGSTETAGSGAPKVVIDEKRYDFETAVDGEIVSHGFVLRNVGNAALIIKDYKSG